MAIIANASFSNGQGTSQMDMEKLANIQTIAQRFVLLDTCLWVCQSCSILPNTGLVINQL